MSRLLAVFDLDGTLFQTQTVDIAAITQALAKCGCPPLAPQEITGLFGLPFAEICAQVLPGGQPGLIEQFTQNVIRHELEEIPRAGCLYPGVLESLQALQALEIDMCICTNGSEQYVQAIADKFGLHSLFAEISYNSSPLSKSERVAALKQKYNPDTLVMVGDRSSDIAAARDNGGVAVGVSYGFGGEEMSAADYIADVFPEVETILRKLAAPLSMERVEPNGFFTLRQAAEGVWAAIVIPGSGALGNAAIIDLGDSAAVVDTFSLPEAARLLREAAELLTGNPVKYVINTHYHGDHHYGNQEFTDSLILSTEGTRNILTREQAPVPGVWQKGLQLQISAFRQVKAAAGDPLVRAALADEISDKSALLAAVPRIRRVTAALTFTDELRLHGASRSLRVFSYGGGHTESDAMVYIEDVKVLVTGDLVLNRTHPAMQTGCPEAWLGILTRISSEIDFERLIPGHGEIGGRHHLREMSGYLTGILQYAKKAAATQDSVEAWLAKGVPAPYDTWKMSHIFEWNFRWLFERFGNHTKEE
ncbi:HAD hydrolase-like protein [Paenibacillus tepidiphilus]|uniref:HAD hydrolase-like protein n=1 Tax=Paenibacillus tepidiphilus TaxID=2608683 RepID=UPI0013A564A0|nr:HAD hydrolase-like protein [Paenibacillus tepidiphilus]